MQITVGDKPLQGQIGDIFHYGEFSIDFNAAKGTFEVQFLMKRSGSDRIWNVGRRIRVEE